MHRKILFFTPIPARNLVGGWHRDQGLLVETTRSMGYDAQLIGRLPKPEKSDERLIAASDEDLSNPSWWQSRKPWAVVTNTWGAPRYDSIRNAIREATPRLMDRLDTAGARSPFICWPSYLYRDWSAYRDFTKPHFRNLAFWHSLGRGIARQLFPGLLDRRLAASLEAIPIVTAESPIAVERMKRFQCLFGYSGNNIQLLPHPVDTNNMPEPSPVKKNCVVSVGRWDAHQKNFPLLLRVLDRFLSSHRDWDAVLPGRANRETEKLLLKHCQNTSHRIQIPGSIANDKVQLLLSESKIFLSSSRYEAFSVAVAEALCSGCSVVAPAHIAGMPWCCGSNSGTVSPLYTKNNLVDALSAEAALWNVGQRDSVEIASIWRHRTGADSICKKLLNMLTKIK
jgi:glycosyltransferase involved in cell wall biosynthesis